MEHFFGKWKVQLEKCVGVAEFGNLMGWAEDKQKLFTSLSYTLLIEPSGDKFRGLLDYGSVKVEFLFKLNEPFVYNSAEGIQAMCTVNIDNGKLYENYSSAQGTRWQTERVLNGTHMTATTTLDGHPNVKCVQELFRC